MFFKLSNIRYKIKISARTDAETARLEQENWNASCREQAGAYDLRELDSKFRNGEISEEEYDRAYDFLFPIEEKDDFEEQNRKLMQGIESKIK